MSFTGWDYVRTVKDSVKESGWATKDEIVSRTKKCLGRRARKEIIEAAILEAQCLRLIEETKDGFRFVRDSLRGFSSDEITLAKLEKIAGGFERRNKIGIKPRNSHTNPSGKRTIGAFQ